MLGTFQVYAAAGKGKDNGPELKIHSFYQSIPIDFNALVIKVDGEDVTFSVHPYEAVALSHLGMAVIKSSLHNCCFRAYTSQISIKDKTATFSHFIPQDDSHSRRSLIRVEPRDPIMARIIGSSSETPGIIYDISEASVTLYVRNIVLDHFQSGTVVRFFSVLGDSDEGGIAIDTRAKIIKVYSKFKGDSNAHRLVLSYETDRSVKSKLIRYISQRQAEIIRELKEQSQEG
jgi:hypothetical protein